MRDSTLFGALSSNGNLSAGFLFELLLCHTTWTNNETNKIVVGKPMREMLLTIINET